MAYPSLDISVIICSHNPREDYLRRTLEALEKQTLPLHQWEILLIDNLSANLISDIYEMTWHPNAHHIREEKIGLTYARLRGITESKGEVLVFVDDDNLLAPNYLEVALDAFRSINLLGALGASRILPEFETPPTAEVVPFLDILALRDESRSHYSNDATRYTTALPIGAGLCILKNIAESYAHSCASRLAVTVLDRSGTNLLSCGDIDLALHACRESKLAGIIPELVLTHLIPTFRLKPEYFVKLIAGHGASIYHLSKIWGWSLYENENPILKWLRFWKKWLVLRGIPRMIFIASNRAILEAKVQWRTLEQNSSSAESVGKSWLG